MCMCTHGIHLRLYVYLSVSTYVCTCAHMCVCVICMCVYKNVCVVVVVVHSNNICSYHYMQNFEAKIIMVDYKTNVHDNFRVVSKQNE